MSEDECYRKQFSCTTREQLRDWLNVLSTVSYKCVLLCGTILTVGWFACNNNCSVVCNVTFSGMLIGRALSLLSFQWRSHRDFGIQSMIHFESRGKGLGKEGRVVCEWTIYRESSQANFIQSTSITKLARERKKHILFRYIWYIWITFIYTISISMNVQSIRMPSLITPFRLTWGLVTRFPVHVHRFHQISFRLGC